MIRLAREIREFDEMQGSQLAPALYLAGLKYQILLRGKRSVP
jgi:hypothetical protein